MVAALLMLQFNLPCSRKDVVGLDPASPEKPIRFSWEMLFGMYRMGSRGTI